MKFEAFLSLCDKWLVELPENHRQIFFLVTEVFDIKWAARLTSSKISDDLCARRYLQDVVAGCVAEVPHADLCAHVPATEGTGRELQAADLQHHVGDSWEGVPLQSQLFQPLVPWETYRRKRSGLPGRLT